ncbi:MAG: hypothetical protein RIB58_01670 [Phycisphaerales bacterium]
MRVARYWARAQVERDGYGRGAWGSSETSLQDAEHNARARAEAMLAEVIDQDDSSLHHYEYQRHDMPEPIVQDIVDREGNRIAAITTNRYGASVLNTARLVFVDIDFPEPSPPPGLLGRLLGRKPAAEDFHGAALSRLRDWASDDPNRGARVYKTAAGLRYLLTHPMLSPDGEDTAHLMAELSADPLYARLCRAQGSFRARLSPKPWRLGIRGTPKLTYEKLEPADDATRKWLHDYRQASQRYAVCALVDQVGHARPTDDDTARLIAVHDEHAGVGKDLPLA